MSDTLRPGLNVHRMEALNEVFHKENMLSALGDVEERVRRVAEARAKRQWLTMVLSVLVVVVLFVWSKAQTLHQYYPNVKAWYITHRAAKMPPSNFGPYTAMQIEIADASPPLYGLLNAFTVYRDALTPAAAGFLIWVLERFGAYVTPAAWASDKVTLGQDLLETRVSGWSEWIRPIDTGDRKVLNPLWFIYPTPENFLASAVVADARANGVQGNPLYTLFAHGVCGFAVLHATADASGRTPSTNDIVHTLFPAEDLLRVPPRVRKRCGAIAASAAVSGGGAASSLGMTPAMASMAPQLRNYGAAINSTALVASFAAGIGIGYMTYKQSKAACEGPAPKKQAKKASAQQPGGHGHGAT